MKNGTELGLCCEPEQFDFLSDKGGTLEVRYPHHPGSKTGGTSAIAAQEMAPLAETLRDQALAVLKQHPATSDEVAAELHKSVLAIRPRLTELKTMGLIRETGRRRPNLSGLPANEFKAL